jgi:hypothetical protein
VAVHRWPLVAKAPHAADSTARSRLASGITIRTFFDPSSNEHRFINAPHRSFTHRPTSSEPVNDTPLTSGCSTIGAPHSSPYPCTRLRTPGGSPTSSSAFTNSVARSGVSSAGLNTLVHPETIAGAIFQIGMAIGKFHGVISPTTPIGWRIVIENLFRSSDGIVLPNIRRPSPAM